VPVEGVTISAAELAAQTLEENAFGNYTRGRYAWIFSDPVPFQQIIPAKGSLYLWNYFPVE
jgi:activating signal cointegrator 1